MDCGHWGTVEGKKSNCHSSLLKVFLRFCYGSLMRKVLIGLLAAIALVGAGLPAAANEETTGLDASLYQLNEPASVSQEKAASARSEQAQKANRQARALAKRADVVLKQAANLKGVRYRYAGSSPATGFDCSGYTAYVFNKVGIELPRSSGAIRNAAKKISKSDLKKGDLVFWHSSSGRVFHVGIYAGSGQAWHAPRPGRSVTKQAIWLAGGRQTSYITYGRI
jgi:cell wall-associated NlpC family hydrolase